MSDRERLVHSSRDPFARQLLEAGLREGPSTASVRSIASGLGLGTGAGLVAGVAPAMTGAVGGAAAPVGLAAGVLKWLAAGVIVGSAVSVGAIAIDASSSNHQVAPAPSAVTGVGKPSEPGGITVPRTAERGDSPPGVSVTSPSRATARVPRPAASIPPSGIQPPPWNPEAARALAYPTTQADDDGALAREAAWIDAARSALDNGRLASAHAALDRYDAGRRVGVLNREALVLRIEVLLREGNSRQARALTERFAATYPADPHVARLRARVAPTPPGIDSATPRH